MTVKYLTVKIVEARRVPLKYAYGMTVLGYTVRRGAPTSVMIRLEGEKRWRRLMIWQFSNAGTAFVRIKGECLVVPDHIIPEVSS